MFQMTTQFPIFTKHVLQHNIVFINIGGVEIGNWKLALAVIKLATLPYMVLFGGCGSLQLLGCS